MADAAAQVLESLVVAQKEAVPMSAQELGIVGQDRESVSVAMVVKNEEETLRSTIMSLKPHVDEIVVLVDDTSQDRTLAIARELADTVELYTWENHFAQARNLAIQKCTKDWILIMDGHEVLHPMSPPILHAILNRAMPGGDLNDTEVFSANIYMDPAMPANGDYKKMVPKTMFLQPRLFRNNGLHHYRGAVHNWLATQRTRIVDGVEEVVTVQRRPVTELIIIHKRTTTNTEVRKKQRAEMNVLGLKGDIAEHPEVARPYFYLANTYYEMKDYGLAYLYYLRYVHRSLWPAEKAHAQWAIGNILADHKKYRKATRWLLKAIGEDWERPEFYLTLGDVAMQEKKVYAAEHWYKCAARMKPPTNGMFLNGPAYSYMPFVKLGSLYALVGEWPKAIDNGHLALEAGYDDEDFAKRLILWKQQAKLNPAWKNITFYDENGRFTFINDLARQLAKGMNVANGTAWEPESARWAHYLWIEWCDRNAVNITNNPKPDHQKWIIRLNGYEIYRPAQVRNVNWKNVDALVMGAHHVRDHFYDVYDQLPDNVKVRIIPYGVDTSRWAFAKREHSSKKTIGVIGILTEKKGPQLLGMVIQRFAKKYPDYKFKLRLDVPGSPSMSEYPMRYQLEGLDNYEWVPRQESMNRWMEDCKFILSTGTLESFSYVIAEGMAKGIKPLIYDWRGARDIWPEECIWSDFEELDAVFEGPYQSEQYRAWIENNYSLDRQVKAIVSLLNEL